MTPAELDAFRRDLVRRFPLVDDHPDVAGVLRQKDLLSRLGPALALPYLTDDVTTVLAPEARGPILGALVARELHAGLVLARKRDANHPGADLHITSDPTWRGHPQHFQARSFDLSPDDRVLVIDDWVTTGNSMKAAIEVVHHAGAAYVGAAVLVGKATPGTIAELGIHVLVGFDEIAAPAEAGR